MSSTQLPNITVVRNCVMMGPSPSQSHSISCMSCRVLEVKGVSADYSCAETSRSPDTGTVAEDRLRQSVHVVASIRDYSRRKTYSFRCTCLLAPELQGVSGKVLCLPDCPVVVNRRSYVNCNEDEVQRQLLDSSIIGAARLDHLSRRSRDVEVIEYFEDAPGNLEPHWTNWSPPSPPVHQDDIQVGVFGADGEEDVNEGGEEGEEGDDVEDFVEDEGPGWGEPVEEGEWGWGNDANVDVGWGDGWGGEQF